MQVSVTFYSYFKELAGCDQAVEPLPEGGTVGDLLARVLARFPRLQPMQRSMLIAVGLEYQRGDHPLKDGDVVSLFPPVQGG